MSDNQASLYEQSTRLKLAWREHDEVPDGSCLWAPYTNWKLFMVYSVNGRWFYLIDIFDPSNQTTKQIQSLQSYPDWQSAAQACEETL